MRPTLLALAALALPHVALAQGTATQAPAAPAATAVKYGSNPAAGRTFTHDGVRLYYEVYGTGEPLLMIHGNGGSIRDLAGPMAQFRKRY